MKIDPHLPARHMRSLLNGCVPKHIVLDADYLRNFRRRCQLYHAANPNNISINDNNAELLMSTVRVSGKELKVLDDPEVVSNFQQIYSNIMKSGTHTWKALLYLNKLKSQCNGFDYRMHFDADGIPDGIVWMSLRMRKLLLRFRDILSLDTQKRQFNNMCLPYIGPVVKTN